MDFTIHIGQCESSIPDGIPRRGIRGSSQADLWNRLLLAFHYSPRGASRCLENRTGSCRYFGIDPLPNSASGDLSIPAENNLLRFNSGCTTPSRGNSGCAIRLSWRYHQSRIGNGEGCRRSFIRRNPVPQKDGSWILISKCWTILR